MSLKISTKDEDLMLGIELSSPENRTFDRMFSIEELTLIEDIENTEDTDNISYTDDTNDIFVEDIIQKLINLYGEETCYFLDQIFNLPLDPVDKLEYILSITE